MADIFRRIKTNHKYTSVDFQNDLIEFHNQNPSITEKTLGRFPSECGKDSYGVLGDGVGSLENKVILDLACGNGVLIERLLKREPKINRLFGIDLCEADLEIAERRIKSEKVEFRLEPAQNVSLKNCSIDIVFCNLAFFLFNPLDPVVNEIGRVLKPGGTFAATISGIGEIPLLYTHTVKVLKSAVAAQWPHIENHGWGDERTWSAEGLKSIFEKCSVFEKRLSFDHFNLLLKRTPKKLAEFLMPGFYGSYLLDEQTKTQVMSAWIEKFNEHKEPDGKVVFGFPLTRLVIKKGDKN